MENEPKPITTEETERLAKLKTAKLETDEDLINLAGEFDGDAEIETEDHKPEPEQSLEFLMGGERYTQD